jgi:hypothetical protein
MTGSWFIISGMSSRAFPLLPTILFGAFDRHNFGDLLFPHIAAALLERHDLIFAGLAERDLRCFGGHSVRALAGLAAEWDGRPANIIHVGGELLTCEAWQAAVMLLPDEAQKTIAHFDRHPEALVARRAGSFCACAYTVPRGLFPGIQHHLQRRGAWTLACSIRRCAPRL